MAEGPTEIDLTKWSEAIDNSLADGTPCLVVSAAERDAVDGQGDIRIVPNGVDLHAFAYREDGRSLPSGSTADRSTASTRTRRRSISPDLPEASSWSPATARR